MKKCLIMLFVLFSPNILAVNTFDAATGVLKLDSVVVNNTQFNDVEVRLNNYDLLKVGSNQPYGNVTATCTDANFTLEKFNAITQGMSLDQVNQVIGCKFDPSQSAAAGGIVQHSWVSTSAQTKLISVYFTESNNITWNQPTFKGRGGF